jgi:purine-binding chemotaxis protein CheW
MEKDTLQPSAGLRDESQMVTFLLRDEEFGVDIMSVREIIRVPRMTKVPRTPAYVDGIANLRGIVLPIIDMRTRFGIERGEETDRTRVLVVEIDGVKTGLRVDRVKQVTRVLRREMEVPPAAIRGTTSDYLEGVVKLSDGQRIVMALNAAHVCEIGISRKPSPAVEISSGPETGKGDPAAKPADAADEVRKMVSFRIGKEEFAFPMENVREILRVQTLTQVPDVPDYVLGVLTVRGRILPVIDLRRLLQQRSVADEFVDNCRSPREEYERWIEEARETIPKDQRIIVVNAEGFVLGLVVDHVNEVLNVPNSLIEPPPPIRSHGGVRLSGIVRLEDGARLIMLLDSASLMKDQKLRGVQNFSIQAAEQESVGEIHKASSRTPERSGIQLVTLLLGAVEYGVPISQIQEIDRLGRITKVPKAAGFIEGITNLRGEVIPVLNTRKRFGLEVKAPDDRTRIIIVDLGGIKTGLVVDSVREVLNLRLQDIAPPPAAIGAGINEQFISGIGKVDDGTRMIVLLDLEKVLSREEETHLCGAIT